MNGLNKAIELVGSQATLARHLGVAQQVVHNWRIRNSIPVEYAPLIEELTSGKVKVEELRPDFPWHIVRKGRAA